MTRAILVIVLFGFSSFSMAAIKSRPKDTLKKVTLPKRLQLSLTALRMPMPQRIEALKLRGEVSFDELIAIAKNEGASLSVRWKAVTALGRVFPLRSKSALISMTKRPEWFLRNAGLVALKGTYAPMAVSLSRRLLKDEALVVRTAAVQTLEELGSREEARVLWASLNDPMNFKGKKSLWIRPHIMRALAKFAKPSDKLKFAGFVNDTDPKVQLWSLFALEKLSSQGGKTGQKLSFAEKKKKWTSWARQQKRLRRRL